ncbi:beta-lactamase family protein [Lysobacter sp. 5GHs7-4]|uniref:serine hydrolase domain-containing protein n=1 Tax=Lysobacter sp. 5GHs7-4 TaxID=2904253 RepID=UPI001E3F00A9|nr:serine hydrolase domain-containing protein [Lysobacter sp. 5GHs7-4]UHQ24981.1 beta-lactamase family protein [Lysobacter sp. 5GHs7-4]
MSAPFRDALDTAMRVPGAAPAMAAVIVQGDAAPWIEVRGQPRSDRAGKADADTRFYIASQTKSFMGLLAAVLDARGEFPLDTSLADVWPALRLPAPADPRRITMADLLSHQEGLTTDTLNVLTAHVRDVPAAEYPVLLTTQVKPRASGFRYANIGDLIYGAALEARTGRHWRQWLDAEVLRPLALDGVSSRTSTVPDAKLSWNHQWDGRQWRALRPKPDALMHAAGGLIASPNAMARWMQANLGIGQARNALPAAAWLRSQQPIAQSKLADGEIDCNGYSLGWYSCSYRGQQALMHPGSYDGAVSVTVLVPSARAGLSLMVSSDSAMEGLQLELMKAFIGLATGQPGETERLGKALAAYPANVAAKADKRRAAIERDRADAKWGGWGWRPDAAAMRACSGRFANPLYGELRVKQEGIGLVAQVGALRLSLEPAQPGLFAASTASLDPPEPLRCDAETGRMTWRDQVFSR